MDDHLDCHPVIVIAYTGRLLPPLDNDWTAARFFLGDTVTAAAIYDAYAGPFGESALANRTA